MHAGALSPRPLRLPSRLLRAAPDERLVAALRHGDERAFEAIYDRYWGPLLGFCRHMLGSREEAEDALQRVFVSAHRHLLEGRAHVNLKPWLFTIARNRCLSMLRARRETLALDDVHEPSSAGLALVLGAAPHVARRGVEMVEELAVAVAVLEAHAGWNVTLVEEVGGSQPTSNARARLCLGVQWTR